MKKTKDFLEKYGFKDRAYDQDSVLSQCNVCGREAWLPGDVKHKKDCELGEVFKEIKKVEEKRA